MPAKPCDACPVHTWAALQHPDTAEGEQAIRRDERRSIARLVSSGVRHNDLVSLASRLEQMNDRRALGHIVHQLLQALAAEIAEQEGAA